MKIILKWLLIAVAVLIIALLGASFRGAPMCNHEDRDEQPIANCPADHVCRWEARDVTVDRCIKNCSIEGTR